MTMARITDHEDRAVGRLRHQYRGKPRFEGVIRAHAKQTQAEENAFQDLLTNRLYANAVGAQLDIIGKIVGEARPIGLHDVEYKKLIDARIARNRSFGRPEDIIQITKALARAGKVVFQPLYPAAFAIEIDREFLGSDAVALVNLVQGLAAAGVGLSHISYASPDEAVFGFEDSDGLGFGELDDPDEGGIFAELIGGSPDDEDEMASKHTPVSFSDEPTKDIDVGAFGMNAQRCAAEILDTATNYRTTELVVTRPNATTIRLTAGGNITKDFRVIIVEAKD